MPTSPGARPLPRLTPEAERFISSVIDRKPKIAVFDCDGTLWSGDAGEDFLYWEIKNKVVSDDVARRMLLRYKSYKQGKIGEEQMCGEMVTLHAALLVADVEAAAARFFAEKIEARIFPEMQELTRRLADAGCELWAVSSTNEWVIRAGLTHVAIPRQHVLAASVEVENGRATARLIRVPTDEGKAAAVREVIGKEVDVAFGNSIHDQAMLEMADRPYAISPTRELKTVAKNRSWKIYCPQPLTVAIDTLSSRISK